MLFQALWEEEPNKDKKVRELDNIINQLLSRIGFLVVSLLLAELARLVTKKARAKGLTIHRCKRIKYLSLFGVIEIPSPYLWYKNTELGRVQLTTRKNGRKQRANEQVSRSRWATS